MELAELLGVRPGVTALAGGGGKTTMMWFVGQMGLYRQSPGAVGLHQHAVRQGGQFLNGLDRSRQLALDFTDRPPSLLDKEAPMCYTHRRITKEAAVWSWRNCWASGPA